MTKLKKKIILSEHLKNAIFDYFYLIQKKYSYKASLKLVSDKYRLNSTERTLLFRGVSDKESILKRRNKLIKSEDVKNKSLYIDGYNVILTLHSYLKGIPLFIGMDGLLRDVAEAHGKISRMKFLKKSTELLIQYFLKIEPQNILILLDSPVSNSKKLANELSNKLKENKIHGHAEVLRSPDYFMNNLTNGVCSSSDSIIANNCPAIFDIARNILQEFYKPEIFSIYDIIEL